VISKEATVNIRSNTNIAATVGLAFEVISNVINDYLLCFGHYLLSFPLPNIVYIDPHNNPKAVISAV